MPYAATRIAVPRKFTVRQQLLAKSLACYCSEDDIDLSRKEFLQYVADRIEMDLASGEY